MKFVTSLFLLSLGFFAYSQQVEFQGKTFLVKEKEILLDGMDITNNLDLIQKEAIYKKAKNDNVRIVKRNINKEDIKIPVNKETIVLSENKKVEKSIDSASDKELQNTIKDKKKLEKKKQKEFKKKEKQLKKQKTQIAKKAKAKKYLNKVNDNYISANDKYKKLKAKGKLSPIEEGKWLKKIKGLKSKVGKAKSKLNKF